MSVFCLLWCTSVCYLCCSQVVVYSGGRRLKDLLEFLKEEMEKAKKDRVLVTFLNSSIQVNGGVSSPSLCVCLSEICF